MRSRKRYQLAKVTVEADGERPAAWTFAGTAVRGTEYGYAVVDGNFPARNRWEFIVRVPKARGARVEVRPRTTPTLKVWEELTPLAGEIKAHPDLKLGNFGQTNIQRLDPKLTIEQEIENANPKKAKKFPMKNERRSPKEKPKLSKL